MSTNNVHSSVLVSTSSAWNGSPLPHYPAGKPEVIVKEYVFPAGAVTEWHSHPVINAGLLLSGELTIVCADGSERTFKAGDAIVEITETVHRGENRGNTDARLIMFYASAPGLPLNEPG